MTYRVIEAQTINTGFEKLDAFGNRIMAELYPKPGEVFEGQAIHDDNGRKWICGKKTVGTMEYTFCFNPNNIVPVIGGIAMTPVTIGLAVIAGLFLFKMMKK